MSTIQFPMDLCSASVSTIQFPMDLCSASVSTIQPISFFHFSMNLCSASAIQFISFLSRCKSKLSIQLKLQISSSKFPLLLSTLSHMPTQNYTTALPSQDTLQRSAVANLVELHASILVEQDGNQRGPRFTKEPSRVK